MTLARLVEEALERHDILRQDLADHLHVSPVSVSKWLRKDRPTPIPWRHWPRLCAFLHIRWSTWMRVAEHEHPVGVTLFRRFIGTPSGQSGHGA